MQLQFYGSVIVRDLWIKRPAAAPVKSVTEESQISQILIECTAPLSLRFKRCYDEPCMR